MCPNFDESDESFDARRYGDDMRIGFWGANDTVTGSRTIIETRGARVLVDCGLFQGPREIRGRNRAPFPVDPSSIDAVVLTHGHIDHSGYLPALVRDGFRGRVWCTPGTSDVCHLLLPDAARLGEEEAHYANVHRTSRHDPALPLYTERDAQRALEHLHTHPFQSPFSPVVGVNVTFTHAGHIIGAASVHVDDGTTSVIFSGDLGRTSDPVMYPPTAPTQADFLVVESTYGDRLHPASDGRAEVARIVRDTVNRGGTLLIPAFAVGRTQEVLFILGELRKSGLIPEVPIYLNSPMATNATDTFLKHRSEHRLSEAQCAAMSSVVHYVRSVEESKALTANPSPKIVISASGMATGGRVLHHLIGLAPDPRNTILFVGHQAVGTRGHSITSGERHVRIYGQDVPIKARVEHLQMLSAHADRLDVLEWMDRFSQPPIHTFINHGESDAANALQRAITDRLGWPSHVPHHGELVDTSTYSRRLEEVSRRA